VLLGGVSGPLVEHAHCPVLIVPRGVRESAPGIAKPSDVAHAS